MRPPRGALHNNAALIVSSYTGHLPTMKLDYAETYGNHGVKYFQDFRSRALEKSKNNISRGGYFPSIHTFGPDPAVESRTRLWDRWLQTPRYRLHNEDHDRREELIDFCKVRYKFLELNFQAVDPTPKPITGLASLLIPPPASLGVINRTREMFLLQSCCRLANKPTFVNAVL